MQIWSQCSIGMSRERLVDESSNQFIYGKICLFLPYGNQASEYNNVTFQFLKHCFVFIKGQMTGIEYLWWSTPVPKCKIHIHFFEKIMLVSKLIKREIIKKIQWIKNIALLVSNPRHGLDSMDNWHRYSHKCWCMWIIVYIQYWLEAWIVVAERIRYDGKWLCLTINNQQNNQTIATKGEEYVNVIGKQSQAIRW